METYELDFCTLNIYPDYILAVMKEGINVSIENNKILRQIANKHFKDNFFVYITHRINSYSVDPMVYIKTSQIKTLIGFAVVSDNPIQKDQIKLEKTFFKKEFKHFKTMEKALKWKESILNNQNTHN